MSAKLFGIIDDKYVAGGAGCVGYSPTKPVAKQKLYDAIKKNIVSTVPMTDIFVHAIGELCAHIDSLTPSRTPSAKEIITNLTDRVIADRILTGGVNSYFTGNGPVGSVIKQHSLIADAIDSASATSSRLKNMVDDFCYPSPTTDDDVESFDKMMREDILPCVTGENKLTPVVVLNAGVDVHTPSGIYHVRSKGHSQNHTSALVINTALSQHQGDFQRKARFFASITSDGELEAYFYHPHEDRWVASDLSYFPGGSLQDFWDEYCKVIDTHTHAMNTVDWESRYTGLYGVARYIFDNERVLPDEFCGFKREDSACEIRISVEGFVVAFLSLSRARDSKGVQISLRILRQGDGMATVVPFGDIPLQKRMAVCLQVQHALEKIKDCINLGSTYV